MLRASDAPSCVRQRRGVTADGAGTARAAHTCPLTRIPGRTKSPRRDDGDAKRWEASSGPGQLPRTSRLAQRPPAHVPASSSASVSVATSIFHILQYLLPLRSAAPAAPGAPQAGSRRMSIPHPPPPPHPPAGAGRAGTGPAAPQSAHRRLRTHPWWVLERRMDLGAAQK